MSNQTATFKRTKSGEWVISGPASIVKTGTVTVTKKDGSRKTVTVERVGKDFQAGGRTCRYGYLAAERSAAARPQRSGHRSECGECGEFVTPGTTCWETGHRH